MPANSEMCATDSAAETAEEPLRPFSAFAAELVSHDARRAAIDAVTRAPETESLPGLLRAAELPAPVTSQARALARSLIEGLRARPTTGLVQGLMREYALSSQEGVALMCLAEALLRVPDAATRDALIADKIGGGEWRAHVGRSPSPFVNAATWGLLITGQLIGAVDETGLGSTLTRLIARSGAPIIRAGVDTAMRVLGEQFVCGRSIGEALANARPLEARGYRYSYDMLGEAATTAEDAERYLASYEQALRAIGAASAGRGVYEGPGLSIKLSALHPRYARGQRGRVMNELYPRLRRLAVLARRYDVGVNIDAEESERLDLSLDLLETLCRDSEMEGWNGVGFVVQAYQKRGYAALGWIIDLARATRRRIMLRLVKGAYWDSEIKRAQVDGLEGFAVFTRKVHTDVAYIACARLLLEAPDAVFPQFATHNALTLATVHAMAGKNFYAGQYEFQCLHGMGEPLYNQIVGGGRQSRPCRVYAPVGSHDTLLAYLVRRLLENGANTSFVNRIADASVSVDELLEDPVEAARALVPVGAPHPKIVPPRDLFAPERVNSAGLDLSNEARLAALGEALEASAKLDWRAGPARPAARALLNPADARDVVGHVADADAAEVDAAFARAAKAGPAWGALAPSERARILVEAAARFESEAKKLAGLICREAGKTLPNALGDVREAVDFLRYYAARIERDFANATHRPLGVVVCISPWNFPIAIFTGQVAAALAAGNAVIAKPAEETPLIAAQAVRLMHEAGIPEDALILVPGDGVVGAMLTAHENVGGVMFTGSTEVAKLIAASLARRLRSDGAPIPLIAETGGQNALIVDSSALPEQVVADALASAFDSAGQRCSALRVLCLQDDIAERMLAMLRSAMRELEVGPPGALSADVGPVISAEALANLNGYVAAMRARGFAVHAEPLSELCTHGFFIAATLIEIGSVVDLGREVFGPVLHVLRFKREALPELIDALNATGYALTGGAHSRIDSTIELVSGRLAAGNIYINRNIIGAVVGVQPFGGHALSGTGPKAGGPLYLKRLLASAPAAWPPLPAGAPAHAAEAFAKALAERGERELAELCAALARSSRLGLDIELPGPVGERNLYSLVPRGIVLCDAASEEAMIAEIACALAAGNRAALDGPPAAAFLGALPRALREHVVPVAAADRIDAVLTDREGPALLDLLAAVAARPGPIVGVFRYGAEALRRGEPAPLDFLVNERSICINTTAAGGNASLMAIG
ncbi:MAG: trifunctional transcriptional regulator/proline dehydrogenase/L-glutamate gamma-semialdehyde dehydrogenase [Roseiarcus sp.]|jgi:RHH-type proline utilization regulon transcriptional repressor/proline dehydrogenase/delta 1-pyrroline-5-carboxylate dehydrogenase